MPLRSPPLTPRARQVLAAAIRAILLRLHGITLTDEYAWQLAEIGTLEHAVLRFTQRLRITRDAGPATDDADLQLHLAVAEVTADAKGVMSGPERRVFIKQQVDRFLTAKRQAEQLDAVRLQIQQLRSRFETLGRQHREFLRKADRLRTSQVMRLRSGIADPVSLRIAEDRLDHLYLEYFRRACAIA